MRRVKIIKPFLRCVSIHAPVWGATTVINKIGNNISVSIHAPVWGATRQMMAKALASNVSIHAPVWGATKACNLVLLRRCFNPRTRVGCDNQIAKYYQRLAVSIHAPVWGATAAVDKLLVITGFQSTHPCGVRLGSHKGEFLMFSFNPRTRVGCDPRTYSSWCCWLVSIHAPVWGATVN